MANIIRRGEREVSPALPTGWDPFRMMRSLLGWDPFREMERGLEPVQRAYVPSFDVLETKDSYLFKADVPGLKESDLEISITGNRLTISGKREAEEKHEEGTYYSVERSYGTFSRSFTLPDGVDLDNVNADLRNGELSLTVPKKPEVHARRIEIRASGKEKAKA